jgi:hypothetical protein
MSSIHTVQWQSSYQGEHDYLISLHDGKRFRLFARLSVPFRSSFAHMTDEKFAREISSKLGFYSCLCPDQLTLEFCAAFSANRYQSYRKSVDEMLARPEVYRDYMPDSHLVLLPAVFDNEVGYKALFTFEQIIAAAGIPASECRAVTMH